MKRPPAWAYAALQNAAAGMDLADIAVALSKKPAAVKRLLNSEWAAAELAKWNQAVMDGMAKQRIDPLTQFQELVDRAIRKVMEKMDCGDDKVELAAAQRILDNAGLRPVTPIAISEDDQFRRLTPAQLEEARLTGRLPAPTATASAFRAGLAIGHQAAKEESPPIEGELLD